MRELNGEACIPLEEMPPAKQQIVCSRSSVHALPPKWPCSRHSASTQRAPPRSSGRTPVLQAHQRFCPYLTACCRRDVYGNTAGEKLTLPHPGHAGHYRVAMRALDRIWIDGHRYMKAGVMLDDFTPHGVSQLNLFDDNRPRANSAQLMQVLDGINQSGLGRVWFAGQGIDTEWKMSGTCCHRRGRRAGAIYRSQKLPDEYCSYGYQKRRVQHR